VTAHRARALRLLALLPLLAAAACFPRRLPPRELYRLTTDTVSFGRGTSLGTAGLPAGALAIATYRTPGLYGDPGIVYRIGENAYGAYPAREWALPLGTMLGILTEEVLTDRVRLTRGVPVFDPPSLREAAYIWRGEVRRLEEVERGDSVFVAVELVARLTRASDDSLLWNGTVRLEQPVPGPTMPAIVAALSATTVRALVLLAGDARRRLTGAVPPDDRAGARPR
jgi:ABC-type uncharacterized transport system auxiliary subunit